jgi:hypothetical protein
MDGSADNNKVKINLTEDEAIVLLEWIGTFNESSKSDIFSDQAEQRVLWDLESCLEENVSASLDKAYKKILAEARKNVRD